MKENNLVIEKKLIKVQDWYDCLLYFLVKE
jgi:hypothetical protein